MTRTLRTFRATVLSLFAGTMAGVFLASSVAAQAPAGASGKRTPPPASFPEKWAGWWEQGDREGRLVPPGFKVLHPPQYREGDIPPSEKAANPDVIALARELAQPWVRLRQDVTDFEVEDSGQICRPTGPFRGHQLSEFQLLVSPEKITVVVEPGSGHFTGGIRRIYLNRPHLKNPPLSYLGDWVGHWEGDALVMNGIGFNEKTWLSFDRGRHSEELEIEERWRLVANDGWLEKAITVEDRFALTRAFTVTRYHQKVPLNAAMPFKPRGRDSHVPVPGRVCIDTPDARRGWMKIHQRSLQEWEKTRRSLGSEAKGTAGQ